ncbi:pentatricopeptide repeat-containing protein At4g21190 isoform X2 [Nymphaea colorata]|uniref:pentatricopeptide repeat-containing protein At4g21190 isoform X2 n=1 Tax=Nymphaea colorata TaxID=210225 RepID=UPI00129EF4C1|nr:pentatricopeptide repeat-containing protein At4g21190 isoform X2 [Nymphaea colorata]
MLTTMFHPRTRFNLLATRFWNVAFENMRPLSFGRGFIHGEKKFIYGPERNVQHVQYSSDTTENHRLNDVGVVHRPEVGGNISKRDKTKILLNILSSLKESKKAVYGALDAWVAWEQNFPLVPLRQTLTMLEKQHQWHRIVQVIKWMLSKGQGTTMGTYEQLIRALDKDERAKEAHVFWEKRIGHDLHSVPWRLCELMISIYYRNNMLEHGVKLFKDLEAFGRKPPNGSIIQKIADSYELLGLFDEQKKVLEKYDDLVNELSKVSSKRRGKCSTAKNKKNV